MKQEELEAKEKERAKKEKLKHIQALDVKAKQDHISKVPQFGEKRNPDFEKHNVFSYVYSQKVHKSHALREKNEKLVGLMDSNFHSPKREPLLDDSVMKKHADRKAKADDQMMLERAEKRKKKEMETKLYQDQQCEIKKKLKDEESIVKQEIAEKIAVDVVGYEK